MVTVQRFDVLSVGVISGILSAVGGLIFGLFSAGWFAIVSAFIPYNSSLSSELSVFG